MPVSSNSGVSIGFMDALFTSTSAVCMTGLVVVNTLTYWTSFGKLVILFLIQIGGLGLMALVTAIMILIGKKVTLKSSLVIQSSFNLDGLSGSI